MLDPRFIERWSAQSKWRNATRRYVLTRKGGYPGVEALLAEIP